MRPAAPHRRCAQADEALSRSSQAAGQAFFVTDGEPYPFWEFVGDILEPLGYGRPSISLPGPLIYGVAWIFQYILTPLVSLLAMQQSYGTGAAARSVVNPCGRLGSTHCPCILADH